MSEIWYKNHPYVVVSTMAPAAHSYACYGIKNVVTGVTEAFIGQLAKAKAVADEYATDLKNGLKSEKESVKEMLDMLNRLPPTGGESGGSPLN